MFKMKTRVIMACLIWMAFANTAKGMEELGFVRAECDGEGYVYASDSDNDYADVSFYSDYIWLWSVDDDPPPIGTPYWLYAKPEEGWRFLGWKRANGYNTYEDNFTSTSLKMKQYYQGSNGSNNWQAVFSEITEYSLRGVPSDFYVYEDRQNSQFPISPDANGVYVISINRKVTIEWDDGENFFASFIPDIDFSPIENGVTFNMPYHDIDFSATYKGYKLSGVPDDISVFVNNNKASPEDDGIYYILPDNSVKIEWTGDIRCKLDKNVTLTEEQEHSISFTMPSSNLTLLPTDVVLLNEEENSSSINALMGETRDVILQRHTLQLDGGWSTLCLPFNVDQLTGTPLEGFTVKELDSEMTYDGHVTGFDNGTLYLNFKDATGIVAGKPYIVRKAQPKEGAATPRYAATDGTDGSNPQQGYDKLLDGTGDGYRWRTSGLPSFCEFEASAPVYVSGYTLTTGNQNINTDPKVWTLQAKLDAADEWTVIDSRNANENAGDALPADRTKEKGYTLQKPGAYQYFRFEVTQTGGGMLCLSELALKAFYSVDASTLVNPRFKDVIFSNGTPASVASSDGAVSFVGTYDLVKTGNEDIKTMLFPGWGSTLYYPYGVININAFRAYFKLADVLLNNYVGDVNGDGEITATDVTALVNFVLNNDDDNVVVANSDITGDGEITATDVTTLVDWVLNGGPTPFNVVVNTGGVPFTYGGGGWGPARAKKN